MPGKAAAMRIRRIMLKRADPEGNQWFGPDADLASGYDSVGIWFLAESRGGYVKTIVPWSAVAWIETVDEVDRKALR